VFSAVAEQMGFDYQTAVKLSCGFGGGMYLGSVCGAVTGGIMAIGLKHGGVGMDAGMKTGRVVRDFTNRFVAKHRSVNCPDLIGVDFGKVDLTKPEALGEVYKAAMAKNAFAGCPGFVRDAATMVGELVAEPA
jgi:C_GCAxxG_C_C family probable redox protein